MSKKTIDNKKDVKGLKKEVENLYKATDVPIDVSNNKNSSTAATVATTIGNGSYSVSTPIKYYGWVCPVCGRVNAPWVDSCPCSQTTPQIGWPGPTPMYPGDRPIEPNKLVEPGRLPDWMKQWGDTPPWGSLFTCGPSGGPIPCNFKQEGSGDYVNPNISTSISTGKDSNFQAWSNKGVN